MLELGDLLAGMNGDVAFSITNKGGRRTGKDRRQFSFASLDTERRLGKERRSGPDRRTDTERRSGADRRKGTHRGKERRRGMERRISTG
jgi:hypothetical protein